MSGRAASPKIHVLAIALSLALIGGAMWAVFATAADPDEGTVSLDSRTVGWNGKAYDVAATPFIGCPGRADDPDNTVCDYFTLTVDIPKSHWEDSSGGVFVSIDPEAEENADFDLFVYDKDGDQVGEPGINAGTTNERVFIPDANSEDGPYEVEVKPFDVQSSAYKGGVLVESRPGVSTGITEPLSDKPCEGDSATEAGMAADFFPCKGIDLAGFLPLSSLTVSTEDDPVEEGAPEPEEPPELNDIWGWTDLKTGREYALVGRIDGLSFVDVTNPSSPVLIGELPTHMADEGGNTWRDVKVYKNHAFVVSEEAGHGMQVFDLTKLREAGDEPKVFAEDAHYSYLEQVGAVTSPQDPRRALDGFIPFSGDNAHNIALNEDSGRAFVIGTSTCGGGPHIVDVTNPLNPTFAGCDDGDSYTHDTQCVTYNGPDAEHVGKEICFNSNEDTVTIVDVTDPANVKLIKRIDGPEAYKTATYTHQAWLTPDSKHLLVDDELDEIEGQVTPTTTYVYNLEDLDAPKLVNEHEGETESIDHNQYIRGNRAFQANYRSGLRVLDTSNVGDGGTLSELGFFDLFPQDDEPVFNGAWSNFPYFKSGTVVMSGVEQGLFVLTPNEEVAGTFNQGTGTGGTGTSRAANPPADGGDDLGPTPGTGQGSDKADRQRRLRAGFGRHRYGRVRRGAFPVQCRVRGRGARVCTITARQRVRGRFRTIGRGKARLRGKKRAVNVRVKLNRRGRRLVRRRPRGTRIQLVLRARDVSDGRVARNRKGGTLRRRGAVLRRAERKRGGQRRGKRGGQRRRR